ncbi:heme-binding protein [Ferrimonas pelagia]|uniref:Uncharacterized protein n=1 Tax=Ferrimonas pelagia TaxID=1177826 RepID=A0ABP9EP81_9GAMM
MSTTPPNLSQPLLHEPIQESPAAPLDALGPYEHLIGTWVNQPLANSQQGGIDAPFSYNVMPLPQVGSASPQGYILKNFKYFEEITFSAIHGNAPNRGGLGTQIANTVFYEQRVYFADGPDRDQLVHAENGSWLYLTTRPQHEGPYGDTPLPGSTAPNQSAASHIVKQISVPHGNSILAYGDYDEGTPVVIPAAVVLPVGVDTTPYRTQSVGNPSVDLTANPNLPLQQALELRTPTHVIRWQVNSQHPGAGVINIPFEQAKADVTDYHATYWLQSFSDPADPDPQYTQLQYTQSILMNLNVGGKIVSFPHVTCNTLTKVDD